MKVPTDLQILRLVHKFHYSEFASHGRESGAHVARQSKIYVPVDCKLVAAKLGVDADIVFGRLYYHMQEKYGYVRDDGSKVAFYTEISGQDKRCINFPLMVSVLAEMEDDRRKLRWSTVLSIAAIVISILVPFSEWLLK
ncbi:MAG: hypothetical protein ACN6QH_18035 [Pseudomonas sp.]|uniref:hypothetical protein n=1 Tax=Pseudomonas sp. TaxID=306 RepID=UPI003D0A3412